MHFLLFFLLPFIVQGYDKFQKELPHQFAYAPNLVCDIVEHAGMYYAAVADAYTFQRSEAVAVWPSPGRIPKACFLYHDHSYIFFSNSHTNRTDILRNREYRSYPFPSYRLIFDNLGAQLYLFEGLKLYKLDLAKIEALWSEEPHIVGDGELMYAFPEWPLDILIANDKLLYISKDQGLALDYQKNDRFIRNPYSKNKMTQLNLVNQEIELILSSNLSTFGYIPVSLDEELPYKISTLPPFPRRPESATNLSVLLLYIIDLAIFILIIYFIRIKTIKGPNTIPI